MRRSISVANCVRSAMEALHVSARTVRYGKAPGEVTQLIDQLSMRVGDVECLHELQAWSARRRLIHPVCF